jgi:hypothetical protein
MYSLATLAGIHRSGSLGSLTTTAGNETLKVVTPSGVSVPLLEAKSLTNRYTANEVWFPVGIWYTCTTGVTVTNAKVTLRKNGVSAATGGVATVPIVTATTAELWSAFTAWTFAAAPAAGDVWSVLVTTTSTAGVINPCYLGYAVGAYVSVSDGTAL